MKNALRIKLALIRACETKTRYTRRCFIFHHNQAVLNTNLYYTTFIRFKKYTIQFTINFKLYNKHHTFYNITTV